MAVGVMMAAERPDLNGNWQLDAAHSQTDEALKSATLTIDQKDDSIQISRALMDNSNQEKKFQLQCSTDGKQCKVEDEGHPAQVRMWYNGAMLVMIETRGHDNDIVTKERIKTSDDGKSLSVEVIHISPPGSKNETFTYTKQPSTAASTGSL